MKFKCAIKSDAQLMELKIRDEYCDECTVSSIAHLTVENCSGNVIFTMQFDLRIPDMCIDCDHELPRKGIE